jgi:hypothetical protein
MRCVRWCRSCRAILDAVRNGGTYRAYKDAFDALPDDRPRRAVVRPGDRLGRAAGSLPLVRSG